MGLLFYNAYAIILLSNKENKNMYSEQEPTVAPDSELNKSPFLPDDMSHLETQPATVSGELPVDNSTSESSPSTVSEEHVDDEVVSTDSEVITEVPGFEGKGSTPPSVIDTNVDWAAIARERQRQATDEYARVAGQMALPSVQAENNNPEQ